MDSLEFHELKQAIELLQMNEHINKLEGKNWLVYRVGLIIRVDIKK